MAAKRDILKAMIKKDMLELGTVSKNTLRYGIESRIDIRKLMNEI